MITNLIFHHSRHIWRHKNNTTNLPLPNPQQHVHPNETNKSLQRPHLSSRSRRNHHPRHQPRNPRTTRPPSAALGQHQGHHHHKNLHVRDPRVERHNNRKGGHQLCTQPISIDSEQELRLLKGRKWRRQCGPFQGNKTWLRREDLQRVQRDGGACKRGSDCC